MLIRGFGLRIGFVAGTVLAALAVAPAAQAQSQDARRAYDLPQQDLGTSLRAVALTSGRNVIAAADLLKGKVAPPLRGNFTAEEAVERLLSGTGLHVRKVGSDLIVERDGAPPREVSDAEPSGDGIVVTGSRIRGAPIASPIITASREDIRNSGEANLGDVARSLPQSFGGGQNPGIGFNVPNSAGVNVGSGSSFNLRGLGSDATLTLLNGHRLPYSSSANSIDVSAIPLAAVDRIEIVPDGASALYGSDAIGGVVNIILRDRFDGLETSVRLGASTDGGDFQQDYSALAGSTWRTGEVLAAYEYERETAIRSEDRDYAADRPGLTLLPPIESHRFLASGRQTLFENTSFAVDGFYNRRRSSLLYALNAAGDLAISHTRQAFSVETFDVAPALSTIVGSWRISLLGTHGQDITRYRGDTYSGQSLASTAAGRYKNRSNSLEFAANGKLIGLPAGPAKLAVGLGVRDNRFNLFRGVGVVSNIDASQNSKYVYGELSLPVVSPGQDVRLIRRIDLTAALRYEHYRGIGGITTPKLGLIYAPSADLDLKLSWGRSFRAPTFIQQFQVRQAALYPTALFTGTNFPAGSTALILFGGNPELKPERATSWAATVGLHPRAVPNLSLEVSYFSTRYVDRIVNPVPFLALALSDPLYKDRVLLGPDAATQTALIASADQFFNLSGGAYDPARVAAVIDTSNVNAGRQTIRGLDALVRYRIEFGSTDQSLSFSANASYLESAQQLTSLQPVQPLSGQLFNPPHFRARGSAVWQNEGLTTSATLSYIGGVTDPRDVPATHIDGMTTLDLTARYAFAAPRGPLHGFEISASAQNVFNAKPAIITTTQVTDTPYDSTNYSPVGRFLSIGITKRW